MRKASQALLSAEQLLKNNDTDGACNRAYYAMFDAAQAALLSINHGNTFVAPKTHRGLIAAFGQQLVLGGHLEPELGATFNKVERLRLLADYTGDPVNHEDCAWAVGEALTFVSTIQKAFG